MLEKGRRFVIIGNGIAGVTCARHMRKNDASAEILIISGESKHFYSRTALMYVYMGHMQYEHTKPYEDWFWKKNRIDLLHDWVDKIDFENKMLSLKSSPAVEYDVLIIATGSKPNRFGWPGQDLKSVQGLYSLQDLEAMERDTKDIERAVIVGGGLIGIEMAEMLRSRKIAVTFLVREQGFWNNILPLEESELIGRHIREHHVDLRLGVELKKIEDDGTGRAGAVITSEGETIDCQFVGLAAGVNPNITFLKETSLETERGVLVNEYFATSIADVYAIGDCVQFRKPPAPERKVIEQVWYTGRMHGETLAHILTKKKVTYTPGPWFNSAKFFDIEYQTYGFVPSEWNDDVESFYWEHPQGKICLRMLFEKNSKELIGVNALGMRLRHEFFDQVLKEKWTIKEVMTKFPKATFDTEFYEKYYSTITEAYNKQFNDDIRVNKRSWLTGVFGKRS